MKKPVDVYLSGGTKSGWQDQVKCALRKLHGQGLVRWSDPRDTPTQDAGEMKLLNSIRLKSADIIFANKQDKDASVGEMNAELQTAKQLGKNIIALVTKEDHEMIDSENQEFRTNKWHIAINMLEKMIWALAADKS